MSLLLSIGGLDGSSLALGLQNLGSLLLSLSNSQSLTSSSHSSVGVQSDQSSDVLEWVALGRDSSNSSLGSKSTLDFVGVDNSSQISVGHKRSRELVVTLNLRSLLVSSEDGVELLESVLGPNAESTKMSSRSQLQKVEVVDTDQLDSGDVSESLDKGTLLVEDDQRTAALNVSSVSHLSFSWAKLPRLDNLGDISESVQSMEEGSGLGGLVNVVDSLVVNDEGDLSDGLDSMSTSHDQSRDSRSGNSGGQSVSLLGDVDLAVPSSPDLSGGKHSTSSAHVTKSSLTSSMSSTSRYSRNTGNGSSSSP